MMMEIKIQFAKNVQVNVVNVNLKINVLNVKITKFRIYKIIVIVSKKIHILIYKLINV